MIDQARGLDLCREQILLVPSENGSFIFQCFYSLVYACISLPLLPTASFFPPQTLFILWFHFLIHFGTERGFMWSLSTQCIENQLASQSVTSNIAHLVSSISPKMPSMKGNKSFKTEGPIWSGRTVIEFQLSDSWWIFFSFGSLSGICLLEFSMCRK